jgi:AcrR family transcriptional regulator
MKTEFDVLFKNASDTKEKMILLALKSYLETGAHLTTFQNIARDLDINQSALYRHFANKEELVIESLKYAAIKGREIIEKDEDEKLNAFSKFEKYIKKNLEYCINHKIYSVSLITLHYFATCLPEVNKLHLEINERRIKKISAYLHQAKHEKLIGNVDLNNAAEIIHSLLIGEMIKAHLWGNKKTIVDRTQKILNASKLLLQI